MVMQGHDFSKGRVFRFLISEGGQKLVGPRVASSSNIYSFPVELLHLRPHHLKHPYSLGQSPGRVASVLFTLDLVAGRGYQPTDLHRLSFLPSARQ